MAARLNPRNQQSVREKIRATQLVNRLENHVFGKCKLDSTQVTAALGLLKKCVPDLSLVSGPGDDGAHEHRHRVEWVVVDHTPAGRA
jgi:hypothetical protein